MIRTSLDQDSIIYNVLSNSALKNEISGKIYNNSQIEDYSKENVVIKSIVIAGDDIQRGVTNVNVHVPDLIFDNITQPNGSRIQEILQITTTALEEHYQEDYNFVITEQFGLIREDGLKSHYFNLRVKFNFFNF